MTELDSTNCSVAPHGEYIVFVDESGDHSLHSIDTDYPIFVLSLCVFRKVRYVDHLTPAIRHLKHRAFGHDIVVLHESDIRRRRGAFAVMSKEDREQFIHHLSEIIRREEFVVIAVVIDKVGYRKNSKDPGHAYHIAFSKGLECVYEMLRESDQHQARTVVICESRGAREDSELAHDFRRIVNESHGNGKPMLFDLVVADKKVNCEGLQIADLTARPIGLSFLRPGQANRAFDIISGKLRRNEEGITDGVGLIVFP